VGVAGALVASSVVSLGCQVAVVHGILRLRVRDLVGILWPALMGAAPFLAVRLVITPTPSPGVYLLAAAAAGFYLAVMFYLLRPHFRGRV
jgi:hypothetical protein